MALTSKYLNDAVRGTLWNATIFPRFSNCEGDSMPMSLNCPSCKGDTEWELSDIEDAEGDTADCSWCGLLMLIKEGKAVDFHMYLHAQDPRWPVDGKNSSFISM